MQPVLEMTTTDGSDLWPVAEIESSGFLPLSGELSPAEVGTAVRCIAGCSAEGDLVDFLAPAADWASRQLPDHCSAVTAALARVLDLPAPAVPPER
ncbi:hypothetical protein [Streptomyces sp. NPDC006446]|uniref:hypothetical protein n=1 Tax=Streptomyces sp. NPDC006446 TaxID=3154301 RepID=UPI0033A24FCD